MGSRTLCVIAHYLIISLFILPSATLPSALRHEVKPREVSAENLIECYGLPYGGIGFLSHILTYYNIVCIGAGIRPLEPHLKLRHGSVDIVLAIVSLMGSVIIAIYTCVRCRGEWQFVLLAFSKLTLSLTLGISCLHRCWYLAQ
jgi:hypothetical protein